MPELTFACELQPAPLQHLFATPGVIDDLIALHAAVSMGIIDLTPERAAVVQQLNAAGIPVIAWQLLPKSQGYWYNLDNAAEARIRYEAFKHWSESFGLRWSAIAIDIEPNINQIEGLGSDPRDALPAVIRHRLKYRALHDAEVQYIKLINHMKADGFQVFSYVIPPIIDERRVGSSLLRRLFRLADLQVDQETLMLYTSFMGEIGAGVLWSYGQRAQSIGIGSTGGGVEEAGLAARKPLSWDELTRDLRIAIHFSPFIFIFSLEGCVREGYLHRLRDFDWDGPVALPPPRGRLISFARRVFRFLLAVARIPGVEPLLLGLAVFIIRLLIRPSKAVQQKG